jgi:hypothetical protein
MRWSWPGSSSWMPSGELPPLPPPPPLENERPLHAPPPSPSGLRRAEPVPCVDPPVGMVDPGQRRASKSLGREEDGRTGATTAGR